MEYKVKAMESSYEINKPELKIKQE
jgi:hypothetical protein